LLILHIFFFHLTKGINLGTIRGTASSWAADLLLAELLQSLCF